MKVVGQEDKSNWDGKDEGTDIGDAGGDGGDGNDGRDGVGVGGIGDDC